MDKQEKFPFIVRESESQKNAIVIEKNPEDSEGNAKKAILMPLKVPDRRRGR